MRSWQGEDITGHFRGNLLEMLWRFPEHVPHVSDMFRKFQGFHHAPKPPEKALKGSGHPIKVIKGNVGKRHNIAKLKLARCMVLGHLKKTDERNDTHIKTMKENDGRTYKHNQ